MGVDIHGGQFTPFINEEKCIEPLGEAKSDYEIACMIAEKLGLLEKYTGGKSIEDWIKIRFRSTQVRRRFYQLRRMEEKGYYILPTDPDWKKYPAGMRKFYEDPENNPLTTPSGKLEFYSQRLAEHFPDDEERPPYPKWIPYGESHQESLLCERAKKYPLLMVSNHPRWAVHSQHEDVTWLREIPTCKVKGPDGYLYHPVWINPEDAAKRGIEHGDVVKCLQREGGGAVRRLCYREDDARRGILRPRGQL